MRKRFFNKNSGLAIISLGFAILLFLTATANQYNGTKTQSSRTSETYSHTLENIPIDIKYDKDKYFISGYTYETEVYLTSTNRLKLDSEINSSTRNFKVVADLSNMGEGTSKVTLQVKDLPSDVSATVSPGSMTVTIGKKTTKSFPIAVDLSQDIFADGYKLRNYELDITKVKVTSDEAIIGQIDHVIATLPDTLKLTGDHEATASLQAVSASGTILPAVIEPAKADISIKVDSITKTVPLRVEYTGQMPDDISDIKYSLSQHTATIQGRQEVLDATAEVVVKIDVSKVTENTVALVTLTAGNVKILPGEVEVSLNVVKKK